MYIHEDVHRMHKNYLPYIEMSGSFTHMGGTSSWLYFSEQNKKLFHYLEYVHDVSMYFNTGF